jgi:hypothetical protein
MAMKKMKLLLLTMLVFLFSQGIFAQVLDLEKTYEITGKAKRGALAKVEQDPATGDYTLYYVTKSRDQYMKFQIYTFDKDFNFKDMKEDEVEFDKVKTKYSWFIWNGELYSVEGNFVEPNLVGTLVLRKKKITYKYDWFFLGYYKTTEILDKVKPRTDDGRKFYYLSHVEDDKTGDIIVFCGVRGGKGADAAVNHFKELSFLKFNKDLDLVKELKVPFQYIQSIAMTRGIDKIYEDDPDNPGIGGMVVVTAPQGGPGMGKFADEDMNNYTYLRVDADLNLVDKISFKSNASYWKIDEMIQNVSNDDVYIFGPDAAGKEKYFNMVAANPGSKFKAIQLVKISNHAVSYITEANLDEIESKINCPPSQKKSPAYEGKKFEIKNYHVSNNGDFLVFGQNFETSKDGNKYNDVIGFHFDPSGVFKAQYSVDTKQNNRYSKAAGAPQAFIESPDGKSLFWLLMEIKGVTIWGGGKPLCYPRIARIDLANSKLSDFTDFGVGGDERDYYLDPKFPFLNIGSDKLVFFGSNASGKHIWFCRVKLQ